MHRSLPKPAAVLAACLLIFIVHPARGESAPARETLDRARALLDKGEPDAAVTLLEDAMTTAPPDLRPALIDLLCRAYQTAATQAEAQGRAEDALLYRDNIAILNHNQNDDRKPPAAPREPVENAVTTPIPAPAPVPVALPETQPVEAPKAEAPRDQPPPPAPIEAAPPPEPPAKPEDRAPILAEAPPASPSVSLPIPVPAPPPAPPSVDVASADAAFREKRYEEAGRLYAALEREGKLPTNRRDHWAYCRWAEVVRRINAQPSTPQEWAEIDAEIQRIRVLSPNNWYGEYLRNRAAERPAGGRAKKSNRLVIRGSAPEEPPLSVAVAPNPARPAPAPGERPKPVRAPQPAPAQTPVPIMPGQWQVRETPSFRILHTDPALAEKAAEVAEAARAAQMTRWIGSAPRESWNPKCEIYLYPTAQVFSRMTGQPEQSPGFSTMGMSGGRIIARRVNLRVDHPNLLTAIMPHEITHVVLADLFPHQQIPRWADEGMAVLSEPTSEQHLRAADLEEPLTSGKLFKLENLMTMDYPEGKYWGLYYAQSVSLTRFLVDLATPEQFVQFVQRAQLNGAEAELKRIYKIDGFNDLNQRWLAYARSKSVEATASAAGPESGSRTR